MKLRSNTVLIVCVWILLGLPSAGMWNANFYNEFPTLRSPSWDRENCSQAYLGSIFGPIGTIVGYFESGFAQYGFKWDCK